MARIPGLRALFRLPPTRRGAELDVDAELAFHLDAQTDELVARGMAPGAARAEAERRFGDLREARRELGAIDRRRLGRARRGEWWEARWRDLRYAARGLRGRPGFAAVVVLTLGLGIGANATMFGIVDRLLLQPPAYLRDAGATGRVYLTRAVRDGEPQVDDRTGYARYRDLRDGTRSFASLAAVFERETIVGVGADARPLRVGAVSANFWPLFDARPVLGRFFSPAEDQAPDGARVIVLSHDFWRRAYAADPAVLGRGVRVGPATYTVIGVAPPGLTGVDLTAPAAWVPITAVGSEVVRRGDYATAYNASWLQIVGRRRAGVTPAQANADLTAAFGRSLLKAPRARPLAETRPRAELASILVERGPKRGANATVATWLAGVALVVLLIACANVTNLLLARALRRQREITVRVALGVTRRRLLAQLLTESVLLALLGGAAALLIARWGGGALRAVLLPDVAWSTALVETRTLAFVAGAALLTGVVSGLAPALRASRPDLAAALKAGVREGAFQRSGLRTALLVAQAALSVVLLVGAGLFVRSLSNVRHVDMGFDAARVAFVSVDLRGTTLSDAEESAMYARLDERLRALPGVERTGITETLPFYITMNWDISVPGIDSAGALGDFDVNVVGGDYFGAMGTAVRRGRALDGRDRAGGALSVVVSESMARALWPQQDPLGRCVKAGADTSPCRSVVGVVADLRRSDVRGGAALQLYLPVAQAPERNQGNGIVARVQGDPGAMVEPFRRALQPLTPGASYVHVRPLQSLVDPEIRPWTLGATMFGAFGALALVISAIGLYSVIAYTVAQRTHELGVRIALGARTANVLGLVLLEGVRVAAAGVALGLLAAVAAGRFVAPLLFDVTPTDARVLGGVAAVLFAVATLASLLPAWRATRVNPSVALRAE